MKKFWLLMITVVFATVVLCGCGEKAPSPEDVYIEMAEDFLAQEDYASAIDILQKGVDATDSKKIAKMLEKTKAEQANRFDLYAFEGTWSEEGLGWVYGGMVLDLCVVENELGEEWVDACLTLVQSAPMSRTSEIYFGIEKEDLTGNVFSGAFEDSWGNTGDLVLTFHADSVECVIPDDMEYDPTAAWGMTPGTFILVRNDDAWDNLYYDEDEYYELYPEEGGGAPASPAGAWIEKGGIRYDDIRTSMIISMSQIMEDIEKQNILESKYELVDILPITGKYQETDSGEEYYDVALHAYVSKEQKIYGAKFQISYRYNDVGGWKYSSDSFFVSSATKPVDSGAELYGVSGKKCSNFSYTDYPQGAPVSLGEIADDILYGKHNILKIDDEMIVFDIEALEVVRGNYSENGKYLTLIVNASLTSALYDSEVEYELDYYNYTAGGWELHHEGSMVKTRKHTANVIEHKDKDFLAAASAYFEEVTKSTAKTFENEKGQLIQKNEYVTKRKHGYITEIYNVTLEATHKGNNTWEEIVAIDFIDTDYSKLIGVWEATYRNETFKITITDVKMDAATDTGTISYMVETSLASERKGQVETTELDIEGGYMIYDEVYGMNWHNLTMASESLWVRDGVRIDFYVHCDEGVMIRCMNFNSNQFSGEIVLRKTM